MNTWRNFNSSTVDVWDWISITILVPICFYCITWEINCGFNRNKRSVDFDNIDTWLFKFVVCVFYSSLHERIFSKQFKIDNAVPLYKVDDSMFCFCSYEPVSTFCDLLKVFEKVMHNKLLHFMDDLLVHSYIILICAGISKVLLHWYVTTLTHWGRVTHICVSKLFILGSDNGLSPGRRQAII